MFERISRSWKLIKASWAVLKQDRQLLIFPLVSALAAIVIIASFALPLFGLASIDALSGYRPSTISTLTYLTAFLLYVCLNFVIFFFNAALVGAAMIRFNGEEPTIRKGLLVASSKVGSIFGYSIIAATVGVVLRFIQERVGFLGRIVVGLLGVSWTVATFMVVPVLVTKNVGPIDAVKESASVLKKTWGENVVGQASIGAAFGLIHVLVLLVGLTMIWLAVSAGSLPLVVVAACVAVLGLILSALVHAALGGVYSAALYRYASNLPMPQVFNAGDMTSAFATKK